MAHDWSLLLVVCATHLSSLFEAVILARLSIKSAQHLVNKAEILEVFIRIDVLFVTER